MTYRTAKMQQVAEFLKQHPNTWIPAVEFEQFGGRQAWRTRISDCRLKLGMTIPNRCYKKDGYTVSEYCYVP